MRTAVTTADDSTLICITESLALTGGTLSIVNTTLTIAGDDTGVTIDLASNGNNNFITADLGSDGNNDTLTIQSLTIENGYYSSGGAIYVKESGSGDGAVLVETSTFIGNSSYFQGGAIRSRAPLEVIDSVFSGNFIKPMGQNYWGGAIMAYGPLSVRNSEFTGNVATRGGGAIRANGTLAVSDSYFRGNDGGAAPAKGGAIMANGGGTIATSVFKDNKTGADGGALYGNANNAVGITVEDCLFEGNDATGRGAALFISGGNSGQSRIKSSSFISNGALTAPNTGGGVSKLGGDLKIYNSLFWGNRARNGSAVGVDPNDRYDSTITYTTVAYNLSGTAGAGGIYVGNSARSVIVQNSILYGNYSDNYLDIVGRTGVVALKNSIYTDANSISGITPTDSWADDPLLSSPVDNGGPDIGSDDSTTFLPTTIPGSGSPAIGIANPLLTPVVSVDQIGATRTSSTAGSMNAPFAPSAPTLNSVTGGNASLTLNWTLGSDGGSPVTDVEYSTDDSVTWRSVDDSTATTGTISLDSSGNPLVNGATYQVRVRAVNSVGNGAVSNMLPGTPTNPAPTPTFPPSAPLSVTGQPGNASATVTWAAPTSAGSFPITDYQAVVAPGGQTCLVQAPATSCTITGLTNGTEYTAIVRALNGAGWGAWSDPSEPFTPVDPVEKSILITGTRAEIRGRSGVRAFGETTGLVGATLQARVHLSGEVDYADGSRRTVADNGTFTWQRRTNKKVYVYFRDVEDPAVRSNRIIIPVR